MKYIDWCKKDPNDERKVFYDVTTKDKSRYQFTSDNFVPPSFIARLQEMELESYYIINDEWHVILKEQ